ncbi:FUSC family protein [Ancylobacter sp.]|uniref:FUSC family protein n=1 Tax=Ancylobacter sp. TaxID=1872567 RepID=UPI003BABC9E9
MSDVHDAPALNLGSPQLALAAARSFVAPFRPRLLFGLRLATSVSLALYITYYLELQNSFWAATTAAIVCQPNLGASLQKGRFRAIGTIVGGLMMVAMLAVFPQQRDALLFCLALWCGLCGVAVVLLRNFASYAAALSGITAVIIFADTLANPDTAFFLAVIRVGEICIGIASAGLVMVLTDFGAARRQLAGTLRGTAEQLRDGFLATLQQGGEPPDLVARRRALTRSLGLLHTQIDAAIGESSYLRSRAGNLQRMMDGLVGALVGWRNAGAHLTLHRPSRAPLRAHLVPLLERLDPAQLDHAPRQLRQAAEEVAAQLDTLPARDGAGRIALDATREVVDGLAGLADAILLLGEPNSPRLAPPRRPFVIADPLPALLNGLRVFLTVLLTSAFWVVSAWPNGAFAIVFAAAGTLIFGSFGDQARAFAKDYAMGAAAMVALGGVLYFAVLPGLSTFPALLTLLFLLYVPLGVMQAGSWHNVAFLGMSIAALPLLGVGNPTSYDAAAYFNLALAIVTGTVIGTLFFTILPMVPPQLRACRLIDLSLRDFRRLPRSPGATTALRWTARLTRRAEALPPQATPEQAGSLMALLALGQVVLQLRALAPRSLAGPALTEALDALATGRLGTARTTLLTLSQRDDLAGTPTDGTSAPQQLKARAAVEVILDTLDLHAALLASPASRFPLL